MANIDNSGTPPNKAPNFGLIVALACVVLLFVLLASFFTIDWEGKRLVPRGFGKHNHPTSRMVLPSHTDLSTS